jgi:hypothetical protein
VTSAAINDPANPLLTHRQGDHLIAVRFKGHWVID